MQYLALARKYRPQTFEQVVGQDVVVTSLQNSFANNKIHHCYLFSGTRGVGKTTLARIIAKAFNCQENTSGTPCGKCENCTNIAQGTFIDVIEIDAASKTKVEDTREVLEQISYMPVDSKYKIYIIDEVHMLSGHSFNALLKTLEEPPQHVHFILATTNPQKIPATVLSRCLQYELRNINNDTISTQLKTILDKENIKYEDSTIDIVSDMAQGSIRDSLSILDRAIGLAKDGSIKEEAVRSLLKVGDKTQLISMLKNIVDNDISSLLKSYNDASSYQVDSEWLLDNLMLHLQNIAVSQYTQLENKKEATKENEQYQYIIENSSPEQLQLYYQILIHAKQDLPFMPNESSGIEMVLLRLVAFSPYEQETPPSNNTGTKNSSTNESVEIKKKI
jgi:DNA polymerase-3 subunit gamma/tau